MEFCFYFRVRRRRRRRLEGWNAGSRAGLLQAPWQYDEIDPPDMRHEIVAVEQTLTLFGAALANGEKSGETPPCRAVLRIGENVGGVVGKHETRAGSKLQAHLLCGQVGAHDAGDRIAIGNAKAGKTKLLGMLHEFLPMGGSA